MCRPLHQGLQRCCVFQVDAVRRRRTALVMSCKVGLEGLLATPKTSKGPWRRPPVEHLKFLLDALGVITLCICVVRWHQPWDSEEASHPIPLNPLRLLHVVVAVLGWVLRPDLVRQKLHCVRESRVLALDPEHNRQHQIHQRDANAKVERKCHKRGAILIEADTRDRTCSHTQDESCNDHVIVDPVHRDPHHVADVIACNRDPRYLIILLLVLLVLPHANVVRKRVPVIAHPCEGRLDASARKAPPIEEGHGPYRELWQATQELPEENLNGTRLPDGSKVQSAQPFEVVDFCAIRVRWANAL
mmetsp:Transcript_82515/g.215011  ORF Transcript_82515/g.215011 Transcript_82515/m.215011 type:complete len:302 (+) Transcript_82515:891-1796(+)